MTNNYKRLMDLNKKQKEKYKYLYDTANDKIKKNMENTCIKTIHKSKVHYYIMTNNEYQKGIKLVNLGQIYDILKSKAGYIKNLSILNDVPRIRDNYLLTQKTWCSIKSILHNLGNAHNLRSFSIIKVKCLESYISKAVLMGKYKVLLQKDCYALLKNELYDFVLVADTNLVVNDSTEFNFIDLYIKYIKIENIDIANEYLGEVSKLQELFMGCSITEKIEFKNFDTSNVYTFANMFYGCSNLREVNIEELRTDNAENFYSMFFGCGKLKELDLSSFNIDKVITFHGMFGHCTELRKVNIDNWVFKNLETLDIVNMFLYCTKVENINLELFRDYLKDKPLNYKKTVFRGTEYEEKICQLQ